MTVFVGFVFITELNILMNPYKYVYCEYNIPFYALIMFWNANLRRPKFFVLSCNFMPYLYYLVRNYKFYGLIKTQSIVAPLISFSIGILTDERGWETNYMLIDLFKEKSDLIS